MFRLSFSDLDSFIFKNSIHVGASELDVLCRVLFLLQRLNNQQYLLENDRVFSDLNRLRKIREFRKIKPEHKYGEEERENLKVWRKSEVIDDGKYINKINSPLTCGDLFQLTTKNSKPRVFVLVGQPCDLAVRPDGGRRIEEAVFIEIDLDFSDRIKNSF